MAKNDGLNSEEEKALDNIMEGKTKMTQQDGEEFLKEVIDILHHDDEPMSESGVDADFVQEDYNRGWIEGRQALLKELNETPSIRDMIAKFIELREAELDETQKN